MSGDKKWTRRAAIGFIGAGAGLFALNTGAATQIYSDRGVNLDTVADPKALLPLLDESGHAEVSGSGDEATVYSIDDSDESGLAWNFTGVDIPSAPAGEPNIEAEDIAVSISDDGTNVIIGCSGGGFTGEYEIPFDLRAEVDTGRLSVLSERETAPIRIRCLFDYSSPKNYSDNKDGEAEQPKEGEGARGAVENPENLTKRDGSFTILDGEPREGSDADVNLRVGFRLPRVRSANCYTLTIETGGGTGNLIAYLVNTSGDRLSDERKVKNGPEFEIDDDEKNQKISDNLSDLFLIFRSDSSTEQEVDFVRFEPGCGQS